MERSLGSVIKLLTPSSEYTGQHNARLRSLPQTLRQLVFAVKRYYRPERGEQRRGHFTADSVNGQLGHALKHDDQRLAANCLRVGYEVNGARRIFKLRPDFARPASYRPRTTSAFPSRCRGRPSAASIRGSGMDR